MNLTSIAQIKYFLEKNNTKPNRYFGQNFLINKGVLEKIINRADLKKDDVVLEVGSGLGVLTKELAKKVKKVFVVEKDAKMVKILNIILKEENINNVEVFNEDILEFDLKKIKGVNYKVVANIPYNISSALIRRFLESEEKPEEMILMVQKEVAQRICQKNKSSLLSLSVWFYAEANILFYVLANSFFPAPKVDSAVIKIIINKNKFSDIEPSMFFKVIKAGFSFPRKQVLSNLSKELKIKKEEIKKLFEILNLNDKIRAEDLKINDWIKLSKIL